MAEQRDQSWVTAASDEERVRALNAGELVHYMGGQTADERVQEAHVKGTPDRLYAEAFGFGSYAQMKAVTSAQGSSMVSAIRQGMSHDQIAKLSWLEAASPEEAYAAEQAGELDLLLGRGQHKGANQADGINRTVAGTASNSDLAAVDVSVAAMAEAMGGGTQ